MGQINVRKRGKVYEYFFEGAKVNNTLKLISNILQLKDIKNHFKLM